MITGISKISRCLNTNGASAPYPSSASTKAHKDLVQPILCNNHSDKKIRVGEGIKVGVISYSPDKVCCMKMEKPSLMTVRAI